MQALVEAGIARPLPDPEIGLVLYRAINLAPIVFGPLIEQMLNVSLADPAVVERFREAAVDLLTRPVFNEMPTDRDSRPRQSTTRCPGREPDHRSPVSRLFPAALPQRACLSPASESGSFSCFIILI